MIVYREFSIADYDAVAKIWQKTTGLCLGEEDEKTRIEYMLNNNPKLSFIAIDKQQIVATILGSTDGSFGYIRHLTTIEEYRGKGIAKDLVELTIAGLRKLGITKINAIVLNTNDLGNKFWFNQPGWVCLKDELSLFEMNIGTNDSAFDTNCP